MCIWACQRCGEAYFANPPETGLCPHASKTTNKANKANKTRTTRR
jgi:hypothetical protein